MESVGSVQIKRDVSKRAGLNGRYPSCSIDSECLKRRSFPVIS